MLECVVIRSDKEALVIKVPIESVEKPEEVRWIDSIHKDEPAESSPWSTCIIS
jgi:hypothetical protein